MIHVSPSPNLPVTPSPPPNSAKMWQSQPYAIKASILLFQLS